MKRGGLWAYTSATTAEGEGAVATLLGVFGLDEGYGGVVEGGEYLLDEEGFKSLLHLVVRGFDLRSLFSFFGDGDQWFVAGLHLH